MPKQIPFPLPFLEDEPEETKETPNIPDETELRTEQPENTPLVEDTPSESELVAGSPDPAPTKETIPEPVPEKNEMPLGLNMENVVYIEGQPIEITPTKVKYFRNGSVASYGYIKAIPLTTLLTYGKGVLKEDRDADELLFDFLVATFDSSEFVRDHYNEMTAEDIDRIVKIFGRINHIDEKEEQARKNQQAQGNR